MSSPYTAETIGTMIAVPILLLLLTAFAVVMLVAAKVNRFEDEAIPLRVGAGLAVFGILVTLAGTWWGMYPWKAAYHEWRQVGGTVTRVDSRLIGTTNDNGSSTNQKFVVTFAGNPQQYGVDDTRAAGVKVGDHLEITCVRRWQQSGTDGYDCNFVSLEATR